MSNEKNYNETRLESLRNAYHFIEEKWEHLLSTTPEERKFLNEEFLFEWWSAYVESDIVDVYHFYLEPHRLQHYLSCDTTDYLGGTSNLFTISDKINEFCRIDKEKIDNAKKLQVADWDHQMKADSDYYVIYQMLKFIKLADDIKERGCMMPLQFHRHYGGFRVHPGSDKQSAILLNSNVLTDDIPCFYVHYKNTVSDLDIRDVKNLKKIKTKEKFTEIFPFWNHDTFSLVGSLVDVSSNGIENPNYNPHIEPFVKGMYSYLHKHNKNERFREVYISYLDSVHRKNLIFTSQEDIKNTLNGVEKVNDYMFKLGNYTFKNIDFKSMLTDNPIPLWIPDHIVQYPSSIVDTGFKQEIFNPNLKRKKLSRESVYRL